MIVEIKRRFRRAVGFRFDAMAAWLLCQHHGVDLDGMDNIPKEEYVTSWVWSAHRSFCMLRYRKPIPYERMKVFIARMRKSEWDILLKAMVIARAPEGGDKKKVQPGENSSSQDGSQE
jgi:hypothetical protein